MDLKNVQSPEYKIDEPYMFINDIYSLFFKGAKCSLLLMKYIQPVDEENFIFGLIQTFCF